MHKMPRIAASIAATLACGLVQAAPVVLNSTQTQVVAGQDLAFNFSALPKSNGAGGTFVVHAQGDYGGADDETLTWDIDGIVAGGPVGGFVNGTGVGGPFDMVNIVQAFGNVEFQRTYILGAADLDSILADGMLSILIDIGAPVGLFEPPNYVEVTLSYESASSSVPEPGALALLGLGLLCLPLSRRRAHRRCRRDDRRTRK